MVVTLDREVSLSLVVKGFGSQKSAIRICQSFHPDLSLLPQKSTYRG